MSKRPRPPYSSLTPAQRGAVTRRARRDGKDPKRVHAALKGVETRQKARYQTAIEHGKRARLRTERRKETRDFQAESQLARQLKQRTEKDLELAEGFQLDITGEITSLKTLEREFGKRPKRFDESWNIEGHHEIDDDHYLGIH